MAPVGSRMRSFQALRKTPPSDLLEEFFYEVDLLTVCRTGSGS